MANMFVLIRKIHLYSAFVIASFLLMYFLTGAVMIMENLFPRMNVKTFTEKIAIKENRPEAQTIDEICKRYDIKGEKSGKDDENGRRNYSFFRPGYRAELFFSNRGDTVQVRIMEGTFASVMNDFHRLRG